MNWKVFFTVFLSILIAEMGDKTQLAVLGFTTENKSALSIFLGAMAAFIVVTLLAVVFGEVLNKFIPQKYVHMGSGLLFIIIGIIILASK